jgi:hypothetical protein
VGGKKPIRPAFAKAAAGSLRARLACQPKLRRSEGWRPGLESNQAWKTLRGFCVATPPPGRRQQ